MLHATTDNRKALYKFTATDIAILVLCSVPFSVTVWLTANWVAAIGAAASGLLAGSILCVAARSRTTSTPSLFAPRPTNNPSDPPARAISRSTLIIIAAVVLILVFSIAFFSGKHPLKLSIAIGVVWTLMLVGFCVLIPRLPHRRSQASHD